MEITKQSKNEENKLTPREQHIKKWNNGNMEGAQLNFCQKLGVSQSYGSLLVGYRRDASLKIAEKISSVFQTPLEEVRPIWVNPRKQSKAQPIVIAEPVEYVPMLGQACASRFKCIICEQEPELFLPIRRDNAGDYALQVTGDCMDPAIKDGEYVIIRPTSDVKEGEIVLARIEDECTIKRLFFKKPNILCLVPDNRKYETIYGTLTDIHIMGKIIHVHRPARRITKRPDFLDEE